MLRIVVDYLLAEVFESGWVSFQKVYDILARLVAEMTWSVFWLALGGRPCYAG